VSLSQVGQVLLWPIDPTLLRRASSDLASSIASGYLKLNFRLAVEGDNSAKMKTMLQYPFFLDLNKEVIKASAAISAERVLHDPDDAFHKGWLTAVFDDVISGFAMMEFNCNFSGAKMEAFKQLLQHPNSINAVSL
jgi:hypothetical protein